MKKRFIIIIGVLVIIGVYIVYSPSEPKRICFGDVCPDNGGVYLMYKLYYPKWLCSLKGGYPVEGYGWGPIYMGCSPIDHKLSE
jgi:hypothetical protein